VISIQSDDDARSRTRGSTRRSLRCVRITGCVSRRSSAPSLSQWAISVPFTQRAGPSANADSDSWTPSMLVEAVQMRSRVEDKNVSLDASSVERDF
jgi:hypothetical protein